MTRILIIDEEPSLACLIADRLSSGEIRTEIYQNGEIALNYLSRAVPISLVLLGTTQPHIDSTALYHRIRRELECSVIYINSNTDGQRPPSLAIGSDDYFVKPIFVEALIARIRNHLKENGALGDDSVQQINALSIDRKNKLACLNGERIRLSRRELQLLCFLADRLGETVPRQQIIEELWSSEGRGSADITVYIKTLRNKFDPDSRFIKTVWGVGYKLVDPGTPEPHPELSGRKRRGAAASLRQPFTN